MRLSLERRAPEDWMDQGKSPSTGRIPVIVATLMVVVLASVVAYSAGRLSVLDNPTPTDTSAEAGFARDMQVHHNQGVEVAMIIRDRTDDPDIRLMAYDVAMTQAQQSGQLYGWINQWGLSQAGSEPSMTWMTRPGSSAGAHSHLAESTTPGLMPGLATAAQIAELSNASGVEAERVFLTLMIAHHRGAVDMAEAVLERTSNSSVQSFATAVVKSQTAEIDFMTTMLAARS